MSLLLSYLFSQIGDIASPSIVPKIATLTNSPKIRIKFIFFPDVVQGVERGKVVLCEGVEDVCGPDVR